MNPSTESTQLSTLPRRYTLAEIDEMRGCIAAGIAPSINMTAFEHWKLVELQLHTAMQAGVTLEEAMEQRKKNRHRYS